MPEIDITRIAGNIGAMNALNSLQGINKQLAIYQTRLATGKRINSAADDPAGLSIASKLQARSEGLKVALGNIGDAKNLLAVAESGLSRINDILLQMRNKAAQAASDTMGSAERDIIKTQLAAYAKQIDDIVDQTTWNKTKLLTENLSLRFQTGADAADAVEFEGVGSDLSAEGLGLGTKSETASVTSQVSGLATSTVVNGFTQLTSGTYKINFIKDSANDKAYVQLLDKSGNAIAIDDGTGNTTTLREVDTSSATSIDFGVGVTWTFGSTASGMYDFTYSRAGDYTLSATTAEQFATYLGVVETAMDTVNSEMSNLGSLIGRLSFKEDQVAAAQINVEAAYNRIMNANMAEEQVNASKYLILQQTATAMLAQANTAPQFLLSLFR